MVKCFNFKSFRLPITAIPGGTFLFRIHFYTNKDEWYFWKKDARQNCLYC